MTVPIVIASHKRPHRVHTLHAVSGALLCVADDQAKDYEEANPGVELLVHPASVLGISPKRQWMFDQLDELFMLDDDIAELRRLHDPGTPSRVEAEEATELIQQTAETAREAGAWLWGLANNAIGRNFAAAHPFRTSGYVNAMSMGLFRDPLKKLHFPDDPFCVAEDYYISGINAFYYRYIWADDRFGFHQLHTFQNEGGLSEYRNMVNEERWMAELKRLFGPEIIVEKHMARKHAFEKILRIPWSKGVA